MQKREDDWINWEHFGAQSRKGTSEFVLQGASQCCMAELSPQRGSGWGSTRRAELLFSPESQSFHHLLPHISHYHTCNTCQCNQPLLEARPGPFHLPGTDRISPAWSASCLFLTIKLIFKIKLSLLHYHSSFPI